MPGLIKLVCVILVLIIHTGLVLTIGVQLFVLPRGRIRDGDTARVKCRTDERKGQLDLIQLIKQINETEYIITTNDFLQDRFRRTGRYRLMKWEDDGFVELQISLIRGLDGGNIGCKHLPSGHRAFMDIIVDVPPSGVELRYQATDGNWYQARDNHRYQVEGGVACNVTVSGTNFKPEVIITIEGIDVTSRFRRRWFALEEDNDGFVRMAYSVEYVANVSDIEDGPVAGRKITCWTKTHQHEPISTSFIIEMTQKPKLDCPTYVQGQIGQKNLTLICKGRMDPGPAKVIWLANDMHEIGHSDVFPDSYRAETTSLLRHLSTFSTMSNGQWEFNLTIIELRREDFVRYTLEVTNGVGRSTKSVQLIEKNVTAQNMIIQRSEYPDTDESSADALEVGAGSSVVSIHVFVGCLSLASIIKAMSVAVAGAAVRLLVICSF